MGLRAKRPPAPPASYQQSLGCCTTAYQCGGIKGRETAPCPHHPAPLSFAVCWALPVPCCWGLLFAACHLPPAACRLLPAACRLLPGRGHVRGVRRQRSIDGAASRRPVRAPARRPAPALPRRTRRPAPQALRPLRFINRCAGLKVLVDTLVRSLRPLANTLLLSSFIWLAFAMLGTKLFMGRLWHCVAPLAPSEDLDYSLLDQGQCAEHGGLWWNAPAHFDNVLASCLTLFEMASLEVPPPLPCPCARGCHKDAHPFYLFYFFTMASTLRCLVATH